MRRMVDDKEMITIDNRITALEQGGGVVVDAYTKAQTDALLLAKLDINKHFDDDTNPEEYFIKQPQNYGAGIQLQASRDDNHHPDYANLAVTPTHVIMLANSANHGDNDDDYTGSIDITDGHVTLDVTDGTDTTTLQIGANSAKLNNVQIATVNDIPTIPTPVYKYQHQLAINFRDANSHPFFVKVIINTDSETKWTTADALSNFATTTSNNADYIVTGYGYHSNANEVQPILTMQGNGATIIQAIFMNADGTTSQIQNMNVGALTMVGCSDNVTKFVTSLN